MKKTYISVVVPVYGCDSCLKSLYDRLSSSLSTITTDYEIVLIDDASPDESWEVIQALASCDAKVKGMSLSRNFGQHYAITAGLDFAQGDWVVVMDCDLQDQPEEIITLYKKAKEGYDLVVGRRHERKDNFLKKLYSKIFYKVFSYFTDEKVDHSIGNFGIYSKKVIDSILRLREQNRSFGLFAIWVGFRRAEININHSARAQGKSAYSFRIMVRLAVDSIVAHSNKLLSLSIKFGLLFSFLSLMYVAWLVVRYFVWSIPTEGWTSLMVSIYFTTGLIIASLGGMGLYIGKIFDEIKGRPLYIINETTFDMRGNNE